MSANSIAHDSLAHAIVLASAAIATVIGGRSLDTALAECRPEHPDIDAATRGAVQDLAYGALRRYGHGDFMLARLLRQPLKQVRVRALLLAALYRLDERPQDAHTTVDQAVAASSSIAAGNFKALTNAVLRNYLRQRDALHAAAALDEIAHYRHPRWWITILRVAYPTEWKNILAYGNVRPPMTVRVNRRRDDVATCLARFAAQGIGARSLDADAILLEKPRSVDRLPGFAEGRFSIQDFGAQYAAPLLAAGDGMRVLDACAAPGGKSAHLLELADIDLVALDAAHERTDSIRGNLRRLGLKAAVRTADCRAIDSWWDGRLFERILADVPCSASGVVRRHPDIKWLRREADIAGFARTQAEILDALWRVLAPGGTMLYATCSLFTQENEEQVAAFAARHPDAVPLPIGQQRMGEGTTSLRLQLTPQAEHDGFYYALLQKRV